MLLLTFVIVCLGAFQRVHCGQCCPEHTDFAGRHHYAQWCSDYCCLQPDLAKPLVYRCCSDETFAVRGQTNVQSCPNWFAKNIWAPILIALFCLGVIISCITCCCCCGCCACCRNQPTSGGVFMAPSSAQSNVVMMSNTNNMSSANTSTTNDNVTATKDHIRYEADQP